MVEYSRIFLVSSCMKKFALVLTLFSALLFSPPGAFAKDKHKHKDKHKKCEGESERDKQARLEADRRANGYYDPPRNYGYGDNCNRDRRGYYGYPDDGRRGFYPRFFGFR
jgi:hypothetical protein